MKTSTPDPLENVCDLRPSSKRKYLSLIDNNMSTSSSLDQYKNDPLQSNDCHHKSIESEEIKHVVNSNSLLSSDPICYYWKTEMIQENVRMFQFYNHVINLFEKDNGIFRHKHNQWIPRFQLGDFGDFGSSPSKTNDSNEANETNEISQISLPTRDYVYKKYHIDVTLFGFIEQDISCAKYLSKESGNSMGDSNEVINRIGLWTKVENGIGFLRYNSFDSLKSLKSFDSLASVDSIYSLETLCKCLNVPLELPEDLNFFPFGNSLSFSPLELASKQGDLNQIKSLLQFSRHKNRKNHKNIYTPKCMDLAAEYGHLEIVKYYNSFEFDCTSLALDYSSQNGHDKIVEFLILRGKPCTTYAMDSACIYGYLEVVKLLHKAKVHYTSQALDQACYHGHKHIVEFLISVKAPCTILAMEWACQRGFSDIAVALIRYSAPVSHCTLETVIKLSSLEIIQELYSHAGLTREQWINLVKLHKNDDLLTFITLLDQDKQDKSKF